MKYILNREESIEVDKISIEKYKIPSIILMENAGLRTALWIDELLKKDKNKKIVIISGAGNNGGDGYVVFRHLKNYGYEIDLILMKERESIISDAKINLELLYNSYDDLSIRNYEKNISLDKYSFIIDAIFGIGLKRDIEDKYKDIIEKINISKAKKLAIDIPSGLNASNGKIMGISVRCDYTATYGYLKLGHLFRKDICGEIKTFNISFPKKVILNLKTKPAIYITKSMIKSLLPIRKFNFHKYQNGNLLLIGGSLGKVGAITMSGLASLRSGVGVATLLTKKEVLHATDNLIEIMSMFYENLDDIKKYLFKKTAIAIGPGIELKDETLNILKYLIKESSIPMVIDADGLNIIKNANDIFNVQKEIVITPHIKEFSRLINMPIKDILDDKVNITSFYAKKWNITIVLKGASTIIASKDGEIYINSTGNSGMATAGSGDVLTGIVSTFLSQNMSGIDSAILGVFIHGLSGDIAIKDISKTSLIATDLINYLSKAFLEIS